MKYNNKKFRPVQNSENGELMTGICHSKPELTVDGKIRLYENWKWTSGDKSNGNSILEEILFEPSKTKKPIANTK